MFFLNRQDCYFKHSNGRAIDEPSPEMGENVADALIGEEMTNLQEECNFTDNSSLKAEPLFVTGSAQNESNNEMNNTNNTNNNNNDPTVGTYGGLSNCYALHTSDLTNVKESSEIDAADVEMT